LRLPFLLPGSFAGLSALHRVHHIGPHRKGKAAISENGRDIGGVGAFAFI